MNNFYTLLLLFSHLDPINMRNFGPHWLQHLSSLVGRARPTTAVWLSIARAWLHKNVDFGHIIRAWGLFYITRDKLSYIRNEPNTRKKNLSLDASTTKHIVPACYEPHCSLCGQPIRPIWDLLFVIFLIDHDTCESLDMLGTLCVYVGGA
jgi:hypothetical protein